MAINALRMRLSPLKMARLTLTSAVCRMMLSRPFVRWKSSSIPPLTGLHRACEMPALDSRLRSILAQISLPDAPRRTLSLGCGDYPEIALLHQLYPGWLHIGLDCNFLTLNLAVGSVVQA